MKQITTVLLCAGALSFSITSQAGPGHGHGPDMFHLEIHTAFTNTGVETNASGNVNINEEKPGHADNQKLEISTHGLMTNTTYSLLVGMVGVSNLTTVTNFTTDANGKASLHYHDSGNSHGKGKPKKDALPPELTPVSSIQELDVFNSSTQAVLTADLTMPDKLEYMVKRHISTNGVNADLQIKASDNHNPQFQLHVSGLATTNDYFFVVNSDIMQTNTSDPHGHLNIDKVQSSVPILQVNSVALWDTSSNVVVGTTLP